MTDFFAVLGASRQPLPDVRVLKERFHTLSKETHADQGVPSTNAGEVSSSHDRHLQLNQAYKCLADTKSRLKHLFQLEFGDGPGELRRIPPDLAEQAFEFGKLCRDADQFLARKAGAVSPLLKVDLLEQGLAWTERFQAWQQRFDRQWSELIERLETLNRAWMSAPPLGDSRRIDQLPRTELARLFHQCGYLTRWMQQARDRVTQLAF